MAPGSNEFNSLVMGYLDGTLSPEQTAELEAALIEHPDAARAVVESSLLINTLKNSALAGRLLDETEDSPGGMPGSDEVWLQLIDEALEARRVHEIEDQAERLLKADKAEADRQRLLEQRRRAALAQDPTRRVVVIPKWVVVSAAAAVGFALLLALSGVFQPDPPAVTQGPSRDDSRRDRTPSSPSVVAVVDSALDARWARGAGPVGGELLPGAYELEAGLVRLSYTNGVSLVVQGPARFRVNDSMHLALDRGGLSATVSRSEGHGFTVVTPDLEVVDLGTEFGVVVDAAGRSEAHVYQGRVIADRVGAGRDADTSIQVSAGQAVGTHRRGGLRQLDEADELAVVRNEEFEVHERAAEGSAYDRWLAWSYQVRRDSTVFAYYPFDNRGEDENRLLNRAIATRGTLDGQFGNTAAFPRSEPRWSTGRWPDKGALSFRSAEMDHVLIPRREAAAFHDLTEVTIACWVRVNDIDKVHHLVTKRSADADSLNLAWVGDYDAPGVGGGPYHLGQRAHSILCSFRRPRPGQVWSDYESPSVLQDQTGWTLLAVSYDGTVARFYLDGRPVGFYRENAGLHHSNADLLIGGAAVHLEPWAFLDGRMDELVIWGRTLDPDEINAMYEAGRPWMTSAFSMPFAFHAGQVFCPATRMVAAWPPTFLNSLMED